MNDNRPPVKGRCPESETAFGFDLEHTQASPRVRRPPTLEQLADAFDGLYWGPAGPPDDIHVLDLDFGHFLSSRNAFLNHDRPNHEDGR